MVHFKYKSNIMVQIKSKKQNHGTNQFSKKQPSGTNKKAISWYNFNLK